ncbi:MAG: hypothetical protein EBS93_04530 [Chitinophagia bacterium]|jgi:hypothetical protein|nr:hypothetical protein [Chitinophagia bacterium]NCA29963.1 hypothetical protein [Chitinophagia bacterium]
MRKLSLLKLLVLAIWALSSIIQLEGCANIVPPSGGPKDSLPPYLIAARPIDSATNVHPKEILVGFNEYITTTSIQENLIISPTLKNMPLIDARLNSIRIRITDTLLDNTTYSIQFGNAIKDVNEGNILKNFTYVFSTGTRLDTGKIKGKVVLAESGRVDSSFVVILHPANKDSAIFKERPNYYTKLNGKGQFSFNYLPKGSYQIFVLPNDYTKKYDDSTKFFAFLDSTISIETTKDSIQLYAFQGAKKPIKLKSSSTLKSNKKGATLKYSKDFDGSEQDILHPLHLTFETPIHFNDSFPIALCDTFNKKLAGANISIDTAHPETIIVSYPWKFSTKYRLIIPQASIKDSLNNILLKTDTLAFITKKEEAYNSATIKMKGFENLKNPILQLSQDDKVKFSYPIVSSLLTIQQLPLGEYTLTLLIDNNNNGKWDTGAYYGKQKRQPEMVKWFTTPLNIRANWENEINLILNK